jgi:hypothetical protein
MKDVQWLAIQGLQFIVEGIEPAPPDAPSLEPYHVLLQCPSACRRARLAWIAGPHASAPQVQDILVVVGWNRSALFVDRERDGTRYALVRPR